MHGSRPTLCHFITDLVVVPLRGIVVIVVPQPPLWPRPFLVDFVWLALEARHVIVVVPLLGGVLLGVCFAARTDWLFAAHDLAHQLQPPLLLRLFREWAQDGRERR